MRILEIDGGDNVDIVVEKGVFDEIKKGDIVLILQDFEGWPWFTARMSEYIGRRGTVTEILDIGEGIAVSVFDYWWPLISVEKIK